MAKGSMVVSVFAHTCLVMRMAVGSMAVLVFAFFLRIGKGEYGGVSFVHSLAWSCAWRCVVWR